MGYYTLTEEILNSLSKLSPKSRREAFALIGRLEIEHISDDVLYWLDSSQHVKTKNFPQGMPYVYTHDPHVLYLCNECKIEVWGQKRGFHLENSHEITHPTMQELREYFKELPTIRPFPVFEYMPPIIQAYEGTQFFALEKSRDMTATWLMVALSTWDVLFHNGRQHIFQSQDAGKTLELVERANTIYENHPYFLKLAIGKVSFNNGGSRSGEMYVDRTRSEILGFPQGPDQIRQFHPTVIFQDEAAFQPLAGEAFAAIKPAIQMGGKFVAISSANRSYFELICKDKTDD